MGRPADVVGTCDAGGSGTTEGAEGGGSGGSGVSGGETSGGEAFDADGVDADGATCGEGTMLDHPDDPGGAEGAEVVGFLPNMSLKA